MAPIVALPDELLLQISRNVDHVADLNALAATCRRIYPCSNEVLYEIGVENYPYLLFWACESGYCSIVERLLVAGVDPNDAFFIRSFEVAAARENPLPLYCRSRTYLEAQPNSIQVNPAMFAMNTFPSVISFFIHSWYPVHCAARKGHNDIITLLAKYGADIHKPSIGFCECLHPSIRMDGTLSERRGHPEWRALHTALCSGHELTANHLLFLGASPHDDAEYPASNAIFTAAAQGFLTTLQLLVFGENQVDINLRGPLGYTALCYAHFSAHNDDMISWLLNNGADINAHLGGGGTLVHLACILGWFDEAIRLVQYGGNIDTPLRKCAVSRPHTPRPLDICCQVRNGTEFYFSHAVKHQRGVGQQEHNRVKLVRLMIAKGASANPGGNSMLPLVVASSFHLTEVMELLISSGADVHRRNHVGCFPLLAAIQSNVNIRHYGSNMHRAVSLLLQHGASVQQVYGQHHTILRALYSGRQNFDGRAKVLMLLLHHGAQVQDLNRGGDMLRRAFSDRAFDECRILLRHGINVPKYWHHSSLRLPILLKDLLQQAKLMSNRIDKTRQADHHAKMSKDSIHDMQESLRYLFEIDEGYELMRNNIYLWEFTKYPETGLADTLLDTGISYDLNFAFRETTCLHNILQPRTCPSRDPNAVVVLAQKLINLGTNVHHGTPVLEAIEKGKLCLVRAFICNGAKVPLPIGGLKTPTSNHLLHMIAHSHFPDRMISLVTDNLDPTTVYSADDNSCYLFEACKALRKATTIQKLVTAFAIDMNSRDANGDTGLMLVFIHFTSKLLKPNYIDWVKVLVDLGSDFGARNNNGETAWDLLKYSESFDDEMKQEIYDWLRTRGIVEPDR